jgi:pyruvate/oxaloacetate carboxyltransferase
MKKEKSYILKKDCPNIGKETGDYYNGEYGTSPQAIARLLERGIIEEDIDDGWHN